MDTSVPLAAVAVGAEPAPPDDAEFWIDFSGLWVGSWQKVLYSPVKVRRHLDELLAEVTDRRQWARDASNQEEFIERNHEIDVDILGAMAALAGRYKSPGFVGEREYRVTATASYAAEHLHHRAGKLGIVAYLELTQAPSRSTTIIYESPPEARTLPIGSVRLGPALPDEHVQTVERFLEMNGIRVPVTKVDLPLR